jgi:hypothetical protein
MLGSRRLAERLSSARDASLLPGHAHRAASSRLEHVLSCTGPAGSGRAARANAATLATAA